MKQEVTNFGKFYRLLRMLPGNQPADELKDSLVLRFTDFRTNSLKEIKRTEYDRMIEWMENQTGQNTGYYDKETEIWRRRTIAAVFGFYAKIREPVTLDYVKGIICRAGQVKDINQIPAATMREIYNVWLTKQRIKGKVDRIVDDELVKYGYLEKGGG